MKQTPDAPQVFRRFLGIVQDRLSDASKANKHKEAWSDTDNTNSKSSDYKAELDILRPHFKPFIFGAGTSLLLFATFRISKHTGRLRLSQTGGYQFEHLKKSNKSSASDALSIPTDIFLSLIVGLSTALFTTDEKKLQHDLARVPLVQGRSLLADELCTDFVKEYNAIPTDFWQSKDAIDSDSMETIRSFIENCQRRKRLIDHRSQDLNLQMESDKIPSPGVMYYLNQSQWSKPSLHDD